MQTFPRLTASFGVPVAELTAVSIDQAIAVHVAEGRDLDWKATLYADTEELAKDVAAFANAGGGIIVVGVTECNGCADASTPVALSDSETRRMTQAASYLLRPYLTGLQIRTLETSTGHGYYVIVVPRSADAPHAVVKGNAGHLLSFPVRDETTTRWLTEAEVAIRYRDRFQARAQVYSTLEGVHAEGISRLDTSHRPWLSVALVPTSAGHRAAGAAAVAATEGFVHTWTRNTAPPDAVFGSSVRAVPGVRRTIITRSIDSQRMPSYPRAELHYDGAGFAARYAGTVPDEKVETGNRLEGGPRDVVSQDTLETGLVTLVSLLAHHAANVGAGGECELRAQLLPTRTEKGIRSLEIHTPVVDYMGGPVGSYEREDTALVLGSALTPGVPTSAASATAVLDELVRGYRPIVTVAASLAADMLGEFGIAEPAILRPDGHLAIHRLPERRQALFLAWARQLDLVDDMPAV